MFPFGFGPFIGFWIAFEAAADMGNLVLPAGGMTTMARLRYMLENEVTFICCTPTYALRMAEVAEAEGVDLPASSVRTLIVAGEPGGSIPATRGRIESAWGARVFDHPGMTEIGPWGFECVEAPGGVHVIESEFIAEVIDPTTMQPVPDGEPGELVLTNLGRTGSPLLRYRTGDQVRLTRRRCACGRWFARAEGGILGRLDDMMLIRGNNVFPAAVEGIIREFDEVAEFRMEVEHTGPMPGLRIEIEPRPLSAGGDPDLRDLPAKLTRAVRDRLLFTPRVELVKPGALPRFEMKAKRLVERNARESGQ
jgi:phenylacetate-CoA ligase